MSSLRFGELNNAAIDKQISKNAPRNTIMSKQSTWKLFMEFCDTRNYILDENRTVEELALILKDWAANMRKKDGTEYKESTVKTIWNITSKLIQEKYYNKYNVAIDPFKSIIFKKARDARDATRKKLRSDPSKRKMSSVPLSLPEIKKIINHYDENTPKGLQMKFYHIAAVELAWRGGEAVACLVDFFHIEKSNDICSRIEYKPIFNKTSKKCPGSKWLQKNNDSNACPVRLFLKLMSKRGKNVTSKRLFLRPNRKWKAENDNWYDNIPVGKNIINHWTKNSAEAIGLDIKEKKITNHSNRSTAISQLAKTGGGAQEQQLLKVTGHSNSNANFIKPCLNIDEYIVFDIDQDQHNEIINNMRGTISSVVETNSSCFEETSQEIVDALQVEEDIKPDIEEWNIPDSSTGFFPNREVEDPLKLRYSDVHESKLTNRRIEDLLNPATVLESRNEHPISLHVSEMPETHNNTIINSDYNLCLSLYGKLSSMPNLHKKKIMRKKILNLLLEMELDSDDE